MTTSQSSASRRQGKRRSKSAKSRKKPITGPLFEYRIAFGLVGFGKDGTLWTSRVNGFNRKDAQNQARALLRGIVYRIVGTKQIRNAAGDTVCIDCIENPITSEDVIDAAYGSEGEATL